MPYYLPENYTPRLDNEAFDDTPHTELWQNDVYELAAGAKEPITIKGLQEKFGFSPSRAATAIQNAHLCGILTPQE
jgi:hypothetical protein